ncbi:Av71 muscle cell intermediate filament [Venturia nashicola]|uniref:Av71 muscle cell intermediate filament n=1 Tax=Venturia nashicola TaxID=86259 RepID=A0A4Z1PV62_9PEZI|nr:Av71 muscle cell intermediate filament [Venturia nashicola]
MCQEMQASRRRGHSVVVRIEDDDEVGWAVEGSRVKLPRNKAASGYAIKSGLGWHEVGKCQDLGEEVNRKRMALLAITHDPLGEINSKSQESRVKSRESRVESRESRAKSRESRVESQEPRVESRESRVKSQEPRAPLSSTLDAIKLLPLRLSGYWLPTRSSGTELQALLIFIIKSVWRAMGKFKIEACNDRDLGVRLAGLIQG